MLTSFAVATALHVIFQIGIGARPKPITLPPFLSGAFEVGGVVIGVMQSISLVTAVVSLVVLTLFLKHTMLGMAMRAAASDFTTTRLMGIRANRVISTVGYLNPDWPSDGGGEMVIYHPDAPTLEVARVVPEIS